MAVSPDGTAPTITSSTAARTPYRWSTRPRNTIVTTIPVGDFPVSVAVSPDGTLAYVANAGDNTVSVINTTTNTVLGNPIPVPDSTRALWRCSPDGTLIYVSQHPKRRRREGDLVGQSRQP